MESHFNFNDLDFEKQFTTGSLPPSYFTHSAHLRLAYLYIGKYGIDQALIHITTQIKHYTAILGEEGQYHATVTAAAVKTVYHFMLKSKSDNFLAFIVEFPKLKNNFKELLSYHYGFDIFNSTEAKNQFVEPDLLPFD